MIKPSEARVLMPKGEELEKRIDEMIMNNAIIGHWPVAVSAKGYSRDVVDKVTARYVAAGWKAQIVADPRDGDFVQIEAP